MLQLVIVSNLQLSVADTALTRSKAASKNFASSANKGIQRQTEHVRGTRTWSCP